MISLTTALFCSSAVAGTDAGIPPSSMEMAVETTSPQAPAAPRPAEGSLFRSLIGNYGWMQADGSMQFTFSENNHSIFLTPQGSGNLPVVPAYEGMALNNIALSIHKDLKSDSMPALGPLPGPVPTEAGVGYKLQLVEGRVSTARLGGSALNWNTETDHGLVVPNAYASVYLPVLNGMNLIAGVFGAGVGYEIRAIVRNSPSRFATNTYSMMSSPDQVFGTLLTGNLHRGSRGLFGYEFGVNNGLQTLRSPNGGRNFQGALRYKNTSMKSSVDYSFFMGNSQIDPRKSVTDFPGTGWHGVISPRSQFFQYHSLAATHSFDSRWSAWSELAMGRQAGDGKSDTIQVTTGKGGFTGAEWGGLTFGATYKKRADLWYSLRYEHFRDGNGYELPSGVPSGYNDLTAGLHYDLSKSVQLRPELRYDWQNSYRAFAYHGNRNSSQLTGTVDMVVYF